MFITLMFKLLFQKSLHGRVGELMGLMGNKVFKKVTKMIFGKQGFTGKLLKIPDPLWVVCIGYSEDLSLMNTIRPISCKSMAPLEPTRNLYS